MSLSVTILGSGSALPVTGRHPSAQLVSVDSAGYLTDCGEGTQFRLRDLKLGTSKIRAVCISHLHGDHYYGLFGLLDSMALSGRKEPIYLIAPDGLRNIILEMGRITEIPPAFPIHFIGTDIVDGRVQVYADNALSIEAFPLNHGVRCTGFLFRTHPPERNIKKEKLFEGFPYEAIRKLKAGQDVFDENGKLLFAVEEYTYVSSPGVTYAYCSDTVYMPTLPSILQNIDLMYHEATFSEALVTKAHLRGHSTAVQAALTARDCGARQLLIGHFSSRYTDIELLLSEARAIFPNTEYATEGQTFRV